jgi:Uncharacterised nucleotidyltransferase
MSRLGVLRNLPPAVVDQGKLSYLHQWRKSEVLLREMARLAAIFDGEGLSVLWLKGPVLGERFYGDASARSTSDLDLLVRTERDLPRIEQVLLEAGYVQCYGLLLGQRLSRCFTHHFLYRRVGQPVEVHWALQRHYTFDFDYRRVWADAATVHLRGSAYRATSGEYELVLRIVGALTDLQVSHINLKPFVDMYHIARTIDAETDWTAFLARRRRERIWRASTYFLGLMLELLGCEDELGALAEVLARRSGRRRQLTTTELELIFHGRPSDARQKLFAFRLFDAPLIGAVGWWAVSLPFRLAVYRDTG